MSIHSITNYKQRTYINFTNKKDEENHAVKTKTGVAAASALGVAAATALVAKRQGFSLNPSRIKNTPIKEWAIFKINGKNKPEEKVMKFKAPEILTIGAGSIIGGLTGGVIFDKKENFASKCCEAVSQFIGNISIPLMFVAVPLEIYKNFERLAQKETKHLKLKNASIFIKENKFLKVLCPTLVTGSSLAAGIITGNRVSNKINEKVHGVKQNRGIRLTDFAPHIDDICLAITLAADKSPVGSIISRFIPPALVIAGIETGKAGKS